MIVLRTGDALAVSRDFPHTRISVLVVVGAEPSLERVTMSLPPWLRKWNGFTMHIEATKRDVRVDDVVNECMDNGGKCADILVQSYGSWVLKRIVPARYAGDLRSGATWRCRFLVMIWSVPPVDLDPGAQGAPEAASAMDE